jgi:hypothetical protein
MDSLYLNKLRLIICPLDCKIGYNKPQVHIIVINFYSQDSFKCNAKLPNHQANFYFFYKTKGFNKAIKNNSIAHTAPQFSRDSPSSGKF